MAAGCLAVVSTGNTVRFVFIDMPEGTVHSVVHFARLQAICTT